MRWTLALPLIVVAVALDVSFAPVLAVWGAAPSFALAVVAFLALLAERRCAIWAAVLAGGLRDLCDPSVSGAIAPLYLLGPHALGMALGASAVIQIRGALKKRSLLVLMTATVAVGLLAALCWTFLWAMRGWYPLSAPPWGQGRALGAWAHEALSVCVSAVWAVPVGWGLLKLLPWWSFPATAGGARFAVGSRP